MKEAHHAVYKLGYHYMRVYGVVVETLNMVYHKYSNNKKIKVHNKVSRQASSAFWLMKYGLMRWVHVQIHIVICFGVCCRSAIGPLERSL